MELKACPTLVEVVVLPSLTMEEVVVDPPFLTTGEEVEVLPFLTMEEVVVDLPFLTMVVEVERNLERECSMSRNRFSNRFKAK